MDNNPVLIVRPIPASRRADYEIEGWIFVGYPPFPLGMSEVLMQWPIENGDPVEPDGDAL